jgi:hypothetical protein
MDVGVQVVGGETMVVVDRDWLGQVTAREAEVIAGIRRHRTKRNWPRTWPPIETADSATTPASSPVPRSREGVAERTE